MEMSFWLVKQKYYVKLRWQNFQRGDFFVRRRSVIRNRRMKYFVSSPVNIRNMADWQAFVRISIKSSI